MSDTRTLSVISMFVFGASLHVATAAAQPVIHVGSASGSPGQTVSFSVTLSSGDPAIGKGGFLSFVPRQVSTPTPVPNVRQLTSNTYYPYSWLENPRITDDGSLVVYDDGSNVQLATTDGHHRYALTNVT